MANERSASIARLQVQALRSEEAGVAKPRRVVSATLGENKKKTVRKKRRSLVASAEQITAGMSMLKEGCDECMALMRRLGQPPPLQGSDGSDSEDLLRPPRPRERRHSSAGSLRRKYDRLTNHGIPTFAQVGFCDGSCMLACLQHAAGSNTPAGRATPAYSKLWSFSLQPGSSGAWSQWPSLTLSPTAYPRRTAHLTPRTTTTSEHGRACLVAAVLAHVCPVGFFNQSLPLRLSPQTSRYLDDTQSPSPLIECCRTEIDRLQTRQLLWRWLRRCQPSPISR